LELPPQSGKKGTNFVISHHQQPNNTTTTPGILIPAMPVNKRKSDIPKLAAQCPMMPKVFWNSEEWEEKNMGTKHDEVLSTPS